mmetsp:Transcript_26436/g.39091  ORF Transcript_26436/g.39091 Transcript_26436/m.39091 type:complete len:482 (-) Transcript_26436:104-1549(-)|eukprot:CAMPEP_0194248408 /NCGR_PEP_ID=MMETSP0158-20130606/18296_1 /TAXON_ID=33649 /ORGANISM="Thalassionema nitzschioides, Strain L26-B" /LENGTH=481 /DNA_ID=CAMNT_0038984707 /DNA_START=19 /DNA_END=1464 /DNA_ORIENTATION=+
MAAKKKSKKITATKKKGEVSKKKEVPPASKSSSSLLFMAIPGVLLAAAASFWYMQQGAETTTSTPSSHDYLSPQQQQHTTDNRKRKLMDPEPGDWAEGYYTTQAVSSEAATHMILYPNGGGDENNGEVISIPTDSDFHALGRLYNDLGQIVQSRTHFENGTALYRGPTTLGTHFQWPSVKVGYKRTVPGLKGGTGQPIEVETLTIGAPKVFYVHNFLSEAEAQELIDFSVSEKNPYKMAQSTGGTHKAWNQGGSDATLKTRTSMNAFDIQTKNSFEIKRRAFRLLRLGGYNEDMADGIQILRYEHGQAYTDHHDYFNKRQSADYSWDPTKGGGNRFATIFLYLSNVEYGGQTVFPRLPRLTNDTSPELVQRLGDAPSPERLSQLVENAGLDPNSWENKLITKCYDKFAIPPRRGDAILFYSQTPMGELDPASLHGACPVLEGTKWAANLWVWNACRYSRCQKDPMRPVDELPETMKAPYDQ